jgi:signal transduction histidine kinase
MVTEENFKVLFPFYIAICPDDSIKETGDSITKIIGDTSSLMFFDVFEVKRPKLSEKLFSVAETFNNRLILLKCINNGCQFRGQLIKLSDNLIHFIGSPWITDPKDLIKYGLTFGDFAIHDPITDVFMLGQQHEMNTEDMKKLASRLEHEKNKALELSRAKEFFLANMSHEIRTPMNAILGMSTLLEETNLDKKQKKYLGAITNSSDHLLVVINDILDISKIQSGKFELEYLSFNLKESLKSLIEVLLFRAQERGNRIKLVIDKNCPDWVMGDEARLKQILINLINNSIKFTENGIIKVVLEVLGIQYKISVIDNGIGIEQSKLSGIFASFTQEDASTTRKYGGTGLGLSISKNLTELMDGTITAESEKGKGATFSLTLPFEEGACVKKLTKIVEEDQFEVLRGKNVLVAEDNSFNQMLVQTILESQGLVVTVVENGRLAVDTLQKKTFDIVLMDIQMPEMGGIEAFKHIREILKLDVPIIALTANALKGDRDNLLNQVGFDGYTSKPFEKIQLFSEMSLFIN